MNSKEYAEKYAGKWVIADGKFDSRFQTGIIVGYSKPYYESSDTNILLRVNGKGHTDALNPTSIMTYDLTLEQKGEHKSWWSPKESLFFIDDPNKSYEYIKGMSNKLIDAVEFIRSASNKKEAIVRYGAFDKLLASTGDCLAVSKIDELIRNANEDLRMFCG